MLSSHYSTVTSNDKKAIVASIMGEALTCFGDFVPGLPRSHAVTQPRMDRTPLHKDDPSDSLDLSITQCVSLLPQ